MDENGLNGWFMTLRESGIATMHAEINEGLAAGGLSLSREDVRVLAEFRAEVLRETERVEFGEPAIIAIASVVATLPVLSQDGLVHDLLGLQAAFYALRDELPGDVPDEEIFDALRGCLDVCGDTETVSAMEPEAVMCFSDEYRIADCAERCSEYRIADDTGRVYAVNQDEWEYDEQACGWDGEAWSDDFDD